jgi:alkanesulfonate monooxygenase
VYATKIAVSFQRLTGGRLAWYLVNEEDQPRTWHGRHWSLAEQIERTGEFLDVAKGFWNNPPFTYRGKYYEVENGGFAPALQGQTLPLVYLSGETEAEHALSARHADVHVLPLESADKLRERIVKLDTLARQQGRTLRYAVEADLVARHSDEEAWSELRQRWEESKAKTVSISGIATNATSAAEFDDLVIGGNLWSGFGLVRPGASAGLVGGYAEIIDRIREYAEIGIDSFILAANPALEEAYRVGEKLLPGIRAIGSDTTRKTA